MNQFSRRFGDVLVHAQVYLDLMRPFHVLAIWLGAGSNQYDRNLVNIRKNNGVNSLIKSLFWSVDRMGEISGMLELAWKPEAAWSNPALVIFRAIFIFLSLRVHPWAKWKRQTSFAIAHITNRILTNLQKTAQATRERQKPLQSHLKPQKATTFHYFTFGMLLKESTVPSFRFLRSGSFVLAPSLWFLRSGSFCWFP